MTLSSLLKLLEDRAFEQLRAEIAAPLKTFRRGLSERGRPAPIELSSGAAPTVVSEAHVANLINAYVVGRLSPVEIHYVANALDVSEDAEYSNDSVRDVVFALSSPDTGEPASVARAVELLEELGRGAAA